LYKEENLPHLIVKKEN